MISERSLLQDEMEEGRTEVYGMADWPFLFGYLVGQGATETNPNARITSIGYGKAVNKNYMI